MLNPQISPCKVCGEVHFELYSVKEMQFGLREEFAYQLCSFCGCMQLQNIPGDLSKYYPVENYYSFTIDAKLQNPNFKTKTVGAYLINGEKKFLGKYLSSGFVEPPFFEWLRNANIIQTDKILDVGTGNGSLLLDFYKYGFKNLAGIDAFIKNDFNYTKFKVYKKNIYELNTQFDFIMLHHAFEHMDDPNKVLNKLYELLHDDSYLLIRTPVMGNHGWKTYGVNWVALDAPRHLIIHSEKSVEILAAKAGFEIKKIVYDDVDAFSIWASEQYVKDIPLQDLKRSYGHNPQGSIFSNEQIAKFKTLSEELKRAGQGDQAAFYLYKPTNNTLKSNQL